jgi:hypothetical protein
MKNGFRKFFGLILFVIFSFSSIHAIEINGEIPEYEFTINDIEWCQEAFPLYEALGLDWFLENNHYTIEARVCGNLYEDTLWKYEGNDRLEKLLERSEYYIDLEISESKQESETGISDPKPASDSIVIPNWIRTNANWWSDGLISDNDFVSGIEFLIKDGIMQIPDTAKSSSQSSQEIPSWIKNNAGWWADGQITDNDFVLGIQFMIKEGIMKI